MASIELKSKILNDKYTEYVYEAFDIQNRDETLVSVPMNLGEAKNFDWNIGVILGGSGSGKTTILKRMGDVKKVSFNAEKPLISNFDWLEPKDATLVLTSMGLSSVPTWLRPFHTLSNGEQYRATLAYLVASAKDGEVILVDEYTSVVDRDVAKAMSFALQKYIRRENKRIILASCHYDILEWLMPDWTCSPQKGGVLERHEYLRRGRPQIKLQVSRVEYDTWNLFKKHHYLTEDVNKSCKFLLFEWDSRPIGIVAIINQPRKGCSNGFAISRVVVLPDFQGMGLGVKISEFAGSVIRNQGGVCFIKTVNPALGEYFNNSVNWRKTSSNGKSRKLKEDTDKRARNRLERLSYSHEYIGDSISGYEELLLPISEMRK
jgi:energy-coupling factor transporter ATP-binding protein EcfA2/GNAT superfamily N-acetyltransferase